jgi:hypothetical protein
MEGVAYKILQIFSMKHKAGHKFEQKHLEAKFGQSKFSEPHPRSGKMDVEFFLPNFKFFPDFEFVSKTYSRFTEPPPSYGFEGAVLTRIGNQLKQRR